MDPYDSKVTSNDEKATGPDSAVTQDAVFGSAGNSDVMFTTAKPSQLDCVVVTRVDNKPVTRLVPAADEAESNPQVQSVGGGQHDADGSECEQQEPTRKRSQNSSDTSQWEKRNSSLEGTPKRVRTASKGNGANPNRRPRSKSESGTSSDGIESLLVEDTLRHLSGSVTPDSADASIKNAPVSSMLEDVLTEKKLTLLRSPDVIQFLQKQQAQKAKENRVLLD